MHGKGILAYFAACQIRAYISVLLLALYCSPHADKSSTILVALGILTSLNYALW